MQESVRYVKSLCFIPHCHTMANQAESNLDPKFDLTAHPSSCLIFIFFHHGYIYYKLRLHGSIYIKVNNIMKLGSHSYFSEE